MTWTRIALEGTPFLVVILLVLLQITLGMRGFDRLERGFERRFDSLERRFDRLDARLDAMERELNFFMSAHEIVRHRR